MFRSYFLKLWLAFLFLFQHLKYTFHKAWFLILKMPGPISQNGNFYSNDASSPKVSWFQISFKSVEPFGHKKRLRILQLTIPYCVSLIMVTITSNIFINTFQTVYFSAVKFTRSNEKNMSFLLIPKSPKVWEKSEAIGPGTFNWSYMNNEHLVVLKYQNND